MGSVLIWTNTDKKKLQEAALDIEEAYLSGVRYRISDFISAFGGGNNQESDKDDDFVIPGPYIQIELFEHECLMATTVCVWYKDEDIKMDDTQAAEKKIEELRCLIKDLEEDLFDKGLKIDAYDALIKDLEKKNEEKKSLIENLEKRNKRFLDRNCKLVNECVDLKEKNKKLSEELAKEKDNKEFEKAYTKNLEEANDRLRKAIECQDTNLQKDLESKEKSIQALMDQLDARDREIEKYKFIVVNMADDLYGKGDLDRGEEDLEDEEEE